MPSSTENSRHTLMNILLALVLALAAWYMVIGSEQVEGQVEMRMDYRGLPDGLVVREGMVGKITVRLRGSREMLRGVSSRDLTYTADLSLLQIGANVLPLDINRLPELRAFKVVETVPGRLLLEVDALAEKVLPLEVTVTPLPDDAPISLAHVVLEPSFATVKGPESQIKPLERLAVPFDPARDMQEGSRAVNVAIAAPPQVNVSPPITTLRYTLALKTQPLEVPRVVQLDADSRQRFRIEPNRVNLVLEVPENKVADMGYLAAIRVVAQPPSGLAPGASQDVPVLVVLPTGARLTRVEPALVLITRNME